MTGSRPLLIGAGNPLRRDDGVGAAVVEQLRRLRPAPPIDLLAASGEAADLLERWRGRDLVFVVDAVVSGAPAGSVQRVTWTDGGAATAPLPPRLSSHGLGVADALALGRALDALPRTVVLFAVEAADLGDGAGLSPPVAAAVGGVVDAVVAEIATAAAPSAPRVTG